MGGKEVAKGERILREADIPTFRYPVLVTLRPICPEDEPLMVDFHHTLSEQTVYYRYFGFLKLDYRTPRRENAEPSSRYTEIAGHLKLHL